MNNNRQHGTLLVLLDLTAEFDTVIHDILLSRLQSNLGINDTVLSGSESYLAGRTLHFYINVSVLNGFKQNCGVPPGSCLGRLLFNVYASVLVYVMNRHLPNVHCYPDDSQLYLSFIPKSLANQDAAIIAMECCIKDGKNWICSDKLMLNNDKVKLRSITSELVPVTSNLLRR